ncbi:MAG: hypothetical protein JWQ23_2001 [Herminiimonas sp.]|nr:hypothetical protein [Herminiimonas sp.]
MTPKTGTDAVIADMIEATHGQGLSAREQYVYREALLSLVRLAKSELVHEIKTNVYKLIGSPITLSSRQRVKSGQNTERNFVLVQQQFEFNRLD